MSAYNGAKANLSVKTKDGKVIPLTFQLKTWEEAPENEKEICIDKAMEGFKILCDAIAPKPGDELLQSYVQLSDKETESVSEELIGFMQAHKNTPTKNLKTIRYVQR